VVSLVAGGMIGAGIFILPALLAQSGPISLFGWIFASIGGLTLANIFGRLSKVIPENGGSYAYTKNAFGGFPAFIVAWGFWLSLLTSNTAIALTFAGYLGVFFPDLSKSILFAPGVALLIIWVLTIINSISVRKGGNLQILTTILKIIPIILVAIGGLFIFDPTNFEPLNISGESNFSAISSSTLLCFYAFLGIEAASIPADNIKDPEKNIAKGTMIGVFLVIFIYIFSTVSVFGVLSPQEAALSTAPLSDAAQKIFGNEARYLVAIGACISTFGALNCWILMQGHIFRSMAKDGLVSKYFDYMNLQGSPSRSILISSAIITGLLLLNSSKGLSSLYAFMTELTTLTSIVFYLSSALAFGYFSFIGKFGFKLNLRNVITCIVGTSFCLWLFVGASLDILAWAIVILMAGTPIYFYNKRKNA